MSTAMSRVHVDPKAPASYITQFDGLRCIAILLVLVWHASLRAGRLSEHVQAGTGDYSLYSYFPHGEVGVALFFFISGFLVSRPFISQPRDSWHLGNYYARRLVRIYPPYLIMLLLCYVVLGIAGHRPADANSFTATEDISVFNSFLASLVYLHGTIFNVPSRLNPPMWSLEAEVFFYAMLPMLMILYGSPLVRRVRLQMLAATILASLVLVSVLVQPETDLRARWSIALHIYLFLCGIFAADLVKDLSLGGIAKRHSFDTLFIAGLAILCVVGLAMTRNDAKMVNVPYAFFVNIGLVAATSLMFAGALAGKMTSRVLVYPLVRKVGIISYSLYLTHIVVMTCLAEILSRFIHIRSVPMIYIVVISALLLGSFVVGAGFYLTVERPLTQWLSKRPRRSRASAPIDHVAVGASGSTCAPLCPQISEAHA